MPQSRPTRTPSSPWLHLALLAAALLLLASLLSAAPRKPAAKDASLVNGLTNAAQRKYGVRVDATWPDSVHKDPRTSPDDICDGNAHTRSVFTGVPYTFTIELFDKLPIDRLAFAQSDYETEVAPKDLQIELDDGTIIKYTLEQKPSVKGKPAWQEVPIGKEIRRFNVTVTSNYEGKNNWGGLGELAVLTRANLDERFVVPGYDPAAPAFVHSVSPATAPRDVKVTLPPQAKPGEHPCLLMTKSELAEFRQALAADERGKAALATLTGIADGACQGGLDFPDPKGPPGQLNDRSDAVAKQHSILSRNAGSLGFAYALTGEKKYAARAAEILRGYAERYDAYPEHKGANANDTGKVMAQRLSEAMWLIPQIIAYDYIYDSGALTDADKKAVEEKLFRAAVTFIRNKKAPDAEAAERDRAHPDWRTTAAPADRGKPIGNWLNFYNAATLLTGAVVNDRNLVDLAAADYRQLIRNGIGEDGMWGEGAIGYQLFAVRAMVPGLEAAARRGIDIWSFDQARVKFMFDSPLWYSYPDATAPGINDSGRVRFDNWESMVYDYAFLRFRDERYAPLINRAPRQLQCSEGIYTPTWLYKPLPEPAVVSYPSMVFGSLGYAILRGGDRYSLLKYGPHGGVHGHYDKLNLVLFAGDELGGEPKFYRYEDALHDQWTSQTVAHNTMAVGETRQAAASGKLLVFEDAPGLQVMRGEVAGAYPGVGLDRTIVVTAGGILDLYTGRSSMPQTWDRTLRFPGKLQGMSTPADAKPLGRRDGYQHLRVAKRTPSEAGWQGVWEPASAKGGLLHVRVAAAKGQEVILATGPDDVPLALVRQQGAAACFGMAYTLDAWKSEAKAARCPDTPAGVSAFEATLGDETVLVAAATAPGPWSAAGWQSDARVLVVSRRGSDQRVLIAGGTFAKAEGADVKCPMVGNYLAQGAAGALQVTRQWTPSATTP